MKPVTYDKKLMREVELVGEDGTVYKGEYTDYRIKRDDLPEGKFAYSCRHGDCGDWVTPLTIEKSVVVNFAGTFITDKEIEFPEGQDYIPLAYEEE